MASELTVPTRRQLFVAAGTGLWLSGCASTGGADHPQGEAEVSPNEDLMREHGLLARVLLVYEEALRRLRAPAELPPETLLRAAGIVRRFIEEYHEKLEEDHLFPRFERAGKLTGLIATLRTQHQAGRSATAVIEQLATREGMADVAARRRLEDALQAFVHMYRPHAAREDTVLFPALHALVSRHEYDALGETFEDEEQKLFGHEGFERVLDEVAALERELGIDDLARYTPA